MPEFWLVLDDWLGSPPLWDLDDGMLELEEEELDDDELEDELEGELVWGLVLELLDCSDSGGSHPVVESISSDENSIEKYLVSVFIRFPQSDSAMYTTS